MTRHRLYDITSIGRPLDPRYKTNRTVLRLMPIAAVIAGVIAGVGGGDVKAIALAAVGGLLVVFGCWALARELVPDDNPGAFNSLVLSFGSFVVVDDTSLLLPFVALFLVRIVNRSTGLKAKAGDSVLVLLLTLWAMYHLHSPLLGLVAALAFASDAILANGLPRQWLFAGAAAAAAGFALALDPLAGIRLLELSPTLLSAVGILSVLWLLNIALTRSVASVTDIGEEPLSVARVRMGMLVGWLVALQALTATDPVAYSSALVWATLVGLIVGRVATALRPGNA
ncbi:MAG: hypothetical protein WBB42_10225 [Polyangiales bacterium]